METLVVAAYLLLLVGGPVVAFCMVGALLSTLLKPVQCLREMFSPERLRREEEFDQFQAMSREEQRLYWRRKYAKNKGR